MSKGRNIKGGRLLNMKRKIIVVFLVLMCLFGCVAIYATSSNTQAELAQNSTLSLVKIRDREFKVLQDYKDAYGNDTYGLTAYLLNMIRIYSIPFGFIGIAVSGIYKYIIGTRKLDVREKGFGVMIGIITVMVICQILPLIFAIVVKGWRG